VLALKNQAGRFQGDWMRMLRKLGIAIPTLAFVIAHCLLGVCQQTVGSTETFHFSRVEPLPGPGGSFPIALDSNTRQLYIPRGYSVQVLNIDTGNLVGSVPGAAALAVAIAPELNKGFTYNNDDETLLIFDLYTLKVTKTMKSDPVERLFYEPLTQRMFPLSKGDIEAIDAKSERVVGSLHLGGEPRAAVSDKSGQIYFVMDATVGTVVIADASTLKVTRTISVPSCYDPHALGLDESDSRLFLACGTGDLVAVDITSGKAVGGSRMCAGEGDILFDQQRKEIFVSCSEGVLSVIRR
jgi:DNA-binding beta-propeller fold protein YncE